MTEAMTATVPADPDTAAHRAAQRTARVIAAIARLEELAGESDAWGQERLLVTIDDVRVLLAEVRRLRDGRG